MIPIKVIIFDFDGTLVDSEDANIESGSEAFNKFGYTLSAEDKAVILAKHPLDFVPEIIAKNKLELPAEELIRESTARYEDIYTRTRTLRPGAKELLEFLKAKGTVVAIATSSDRLQVDQFIKTFGFENIFSSIVSQEDVRQRKPDPEAYLLSLKRLGVRPEDALAIEDSEIGLAAAKGAGLKCTVIPSSQTKGQDFSRADYIFGSLTEVKQLL